MTLRTSDKAISRCPDCGAWRWWHRCWTCVPKAGKSENDNYQEAS